MRTEQDELGSALLPDHALYGLQTARALDNFALAYKPVNLRLVYAIVTVKKAAAQTYQSLNIKPETYAAIEKACNQVLSGQHDDQFQVDALQGGAGTTTHMNVNEVLASLAGAGVHPLDDVNRGQSTNDVYPTALRIAAIALLRSVSEECAKLQQALQRKELEFGDINKLGRTELMDAVPITLGEEFGSYAQAIARDRWRIYKIEERLRQVNLGGTAVGKADTAERRYRFTIIEKLRELTGIGLAEAEYPMDITQNNDVFVEVSGLLKALAVNLMKIANDLRLMNSGPKGGLGELRLAAMQKGSTIMPGKINPVIPEMTMQVAMRVIANDTAITMAAAHGEFELNAFLPLIADSLLESLSLLEHGIGLFRTRCIELVQANQAQCAYLLEQSCAFATAYIPTLGYDAVTAIIHACGGDAALVRNMLEQAMQEKGQSNE